MSTLSKEFLALQAALAGEYSLEKELGRGGMGVVYLARDVLADAKTQLGSSVAALEEVLSSGASGPRPCL